MSLAVVFLKSAEHDLKDLKGYLIKNFDRDTWNTSYSKIKNTVGILRDFPVGGTMPEALESMNLTQYRQVISGKKRFTIVCDTRKDMKSLLTRRLLRIN